MVPSEAIMFGAGGLAAAVVADGHVSLRHLTVQQDDGAAVAVSGGLHPGDRIILSPPINVTEGMRVRTS
jgi:multidrug efflux pump subunit AcrA (membrane-fusion protein)